MTQHIASVVLVHVARRWWTFHRRHMLLALAEALPEDTALVCIDRPITPDVTLWKYPSRFWTGVWCTREEEDGDRVRVLTLRLVAHDITADRVPVLQPVNRWLARTQLHHYLQARFPDAQRVIQWIYHPVQRWVLDVLPDAGSVYECYDEYSCTPAGRSVASRWAKEERVLRRADLTFVTSQSLAATRAGPARRIVLLPNGVPDFFLATSETVPDPIDAIPHPRIVYLGNLRSPVDVALLEDVFRRRPDWHLVHVGPVDRSVKIAALRRLENAHFLGWYPYERIPGLLRRCDVGLMPFRINEFSRALNPLKTWEYLACGLPVVASDLPGLRSLGSLIDIAPNDAGSFADAIEAALAVDGPSHARRAIAAAHEFSWSALVRHCVLPEIKQVFGI